MTIKGCGLYCGRVYIGNQTKGNFYSKNHKFTKIENTTSSIQNDILAVVNSYLGLMRHFSSYKIRKRQVLKLLKSSKSSFYSFEDLEILFDFFKEGESWVFFLFESFFGTINN